MLIENRSYPSSEYVGERGRDKSTISNQQFPSRNRSSSNKTRSSDISICSGSRAVWPNSWDNIGWDQRPALEVEWGLRLAEWRVDPGSSRITVREGEVCCKRKVRRRARRTIVASRGVVGRRVPRRALHSGLRTTKSSERCASRRTPEVCYRIWRTSPTRLVTRSRSRYSSKGMAYLRVTPVISLKAATSMVGDFALWAAI